MKSPPSSSVKLMRACVLLVAGLTANLAHAQFGVAWRETPKIVVMSVGGDPRLSLVDEAVSFWNKTLDEVGSGFRLGPVTRVVRPIPEEALQSLSQSGSRGRWVGIRGPNLPPMNLPNVARNVIAHELGHAIGLGHNSDPTKLMCGRPAECRPPLFRSDQPRLFPVTDDEKDQLLRMYPPEWKPQPP